MRFRTTKSGVAICPFFTWQSENIEGLGQQENDVSLVFCNHPENQNQYEGNCHEKDCFLMKEKDEKDVSGNTQQVGPER